MAGERDGAAAGGGSTREILAWIGAAALLLFLAYPAARPSTAESGAEAAGRVVGTLVATIAIALVFRLVWVKAIRRRAGLRVWSPWVLVIAAVVALLSVAGRAAEDAGSGADAPPPRAEPVEVYAFAAASASRVPATRSGIVRSRSTGSALKTKRT